MQDTLDRVLHLPPFHKDTPRADTQSAMSVCGQSCVAPSISFEGLRVAVERIAVDLQVELAVDHHVHPADTADVHLLLDMAPEGLETSCTSDSTPDSEPGRALAAFVKPSDPFHGVIVSPTGRVLVRLVEICGWGPRMGGCVDKESAFGFSLFSAATGEVGGETESPPVWGGGERRGRPGP